MPVFRYVWGVERPRDKIRRHTLNITVAAAAARAEAEQEIADARRNYERRLARIDADVAAEKLQLEIVRLSTPNGRYDRKIALNVAAKFGLLDDQGEKRGPGRPCKYGPDDPRPRRPSRAKTRAGRLRAKVLRFSTSAAFTALAPPPSARSGETELSAPLGVGTGDATLPGASHDLLHLDGSAHFTPPAEDPPQTAESIRLDPDELAAKHRGLTLRALQHMADSAQPLSAHDVTLRSAYLQAHVQQHHLAHARQRGQDGAKMHEYDFSDPFDLSKVKPEVRTVCTGLGLSRHTPTCDEKNPDHGMPLADLEAWMKAAYFNNIDFPAAHFEKSVTQYKDARGFYRMFRWRFEPIINAERLRIAVWPYVERRLRLVEWYAMLLSRGEIDRDTAQAFSAYDDFRLIGRLDVEAQAVFRKIVDAMKWFEGFSPSELRQWAQSEVSNPMCRVHQGFPAWAFRSDLAAPFIEGHLIDASSKLDYQAPSTQELIDFAAYDDEMQIENQMILGNISYSDVMI